jgi:hypothetical protein
MEKRVDANASLLLMEHFMDPAGKYGRVHLTAWHKRCVRGYLHIGYLAYPYHHLHTQKTEVICIEMPGTFVLFWGLSVTRTVVSGTLLPSLAVACAHCAL